MKCKLFIICIVLFYYSNSQTTFTAFTPTILPNTPNPSSIVKIATKVYMPNLGYKIAGSYTVPFPISPITTNTITIKNIYCDGTNGIGMNLHDTVEIGTLYKASYIVVFKAYYGNSLNSCNLTDSIQNTLSFNVVTVSINENNLVLNSIIIYPNSFKDKCNVTITGSKQVNLIVTNILGKVLITNKFMTNNCEIDLSNYPSGVYFARLEFEGNYKIVKLLKE